MIEVGLGMILAALVLAWFIHGLTRHRDMRSDQYRESGEFDGYIDVKKRNKEKQS